MSGPHVWESEREREREEAQQTQAEIDAQVWSLESQRGPEHAANSSKRNRHSPDRGADHNEGDSLSLAKRKEVMIAVVP